MSSDIQPDQEPNEPSETAEVSANKGTSGRKSFSKLRRELIDEELASPAVQRMLLDEIERLDDALIAYHQYRDKFHACDKQLGALQERFKSKISIEIIHAVCIAVGGASIGYATSNWAVQPVGMLALVFGAVLLVAGFIAKAVKP
jgi:hypothetical protein